MLFVLFKVSFLFFVEKTTGLVIFDFLSVLLAKFAAEIPAHELALRNLKLLVHPRQNFPLICKLLLLVSDLQIQL